MRAAFADEIETLAAEDNRIVLLSGDIGNRMFDTFKEKSPDNFYNCGVAEANMIGMAAGMALCGQEPDTQFDANARRTRRASQIDDRRHRRNPSHDRLPRPQNRPLSMVRIQVALPAFYNGRSRCDKLS